MVVKVPLKVGKSSTTLRAHVTASIVQVRADMDAMTDLSHMSGLPEDHSTSFDQVRVRILHTVHSR